MGGREAGREEGAHSRAAWKVSIPPDAGSHARFRTGGRAAKDKSLCGRLRGQQLEGTVTRYRMRDFALVVAEQMPCAVASATGLSLC